LEAYNVSNIKHLVIRNITVRKVEYEVTVSATGQFSTTCNGRQYTANSLAKLRQKVVEATKRGPTRIDVPFSRVETNGTVRHGSVISRNSWTRVLTVRWEDTGKTEQIHANNLNAVCRLDDDKGEQLKNLILGVQEAQRRLSVYWAELNVSVEQRVQEAVDAATVKKEPKKEEKEVEPSKAPTSEGSGDPVPEPHLEEVGLPGSEVAATGPYA
jgi:hypothetical protein